MKMKIKWTGARVSNKIDRPFVHVDQTAVIDPFECEVEYTTEEYAAMQEGQTRRAPFVSEIKDAIEQLIIVIKEELS